MESSALDRLQLARRQGGEQVERIRCGRAVDRTTADAAPPQGPLSFELWLMSWRHMQSGSAAVAIRQMQLAVSTLSFLTKYAHHEMGTWCRGAPRPGRR